MREKECTSTHCPYLQVPKVVQSTTRGTWKALEIPLFNLPNWENCPLSKVNLYSKDFSCVLTTGLNLAQTQNISKLQGDRLLGTTVLRVWGLIYISKNCAKIRFLAICSNMAQIWSKFWLKTSKVSGWSCWPYWPKYVPTISVEKGNTGHSALSRSRSPRTC